MGGINRSTSPIRPQAKCLAYNAGRCVAGRSANRSKVYPPDGWYGAAIRIGTIVSPQ